MELLAQKVNCHLVLIKGLILTKGVVHVTGWLGGSRLCHLSLYLIDVVFIRSRDIEDKNVDHVIEVALN